MADSVETNGPASQESRPELDRNQRTLITAFILFHIVAILSWSIPANSLAVTKVKNAVAPYMLWMGLFHVWDMFAPEPPMLNAYVDAEVTFRNGEVQTWKFPQMQELSLTDKYFKERFRKFVNERVRNDDYSRLWPDAARYVARVNNRSSNPPALVRLVRHWSFIPPPPARGAQPFQARWNRYVYFTYRVQERDLL